MSKDVRKMIDKVKNFKQFINENVQKPTYSMLTGVSLKKWNDVWKDKNIGDRSTNVTPDLDFAIGYSYNYDSTGKLMKLRTVVEIDNIPLDAFVAYREDEYDDDDDFQTMNNMNDADKIHIIENYNLFLVKLQPYKDQITTKLIKRGEDF